MFFFKNLHLRTKPQQIDQLDDFGAKDAKTSRRSLTNMPAPSPIPTIEPRDAQYPISALPPIMRSAAESIQNSVQAPMSLCAQSVLGASSLAVSYLAKVETLAPMSASDCSVLLAGIAISGERKTAGDKLATGGLHRLQEQLHAEHQRALAEYDRSEDPQKERPIFKSFLFGDPSFPGLLKAIVNGPHFAGLFTDEGAQLFGGIAMAPEVKASTSAGFSDLWDGKAISRPRAGDSSPSYIPPTALTMNVMFQPVILGKTFGDEMLVGQGLMSRILPTWPASTMGTRLYREPTDEDLANIAAFQQRTVELVLRGLESDEQCSGKRILNLSRGGRSALIDFANEFEVQLKPGEDLHDISGFVSKAAEHVARLSGVFTLFAEPEADSVSEDTVLRACELLRYYIDEFRHIRAVASADEQLLRAKETMRWLLNKGKPGQKFCTENVLQYGPTAVRNKKALDAVLQILEEYNWIAPLPSGTVVSGKPRKRAFMINSRAKKA